MAQSKIEFRLGDMHFIGEGEKTWVTKQLDKIISKAPSLHRASENKTSSSAEPGESERTNHRSKNTKKSSNTIARNSNAPNVAAVKSSATTKDLASFIRSKKAGSN